MASDQKPRRDPADDGPEVVICSFFRVCPEGSDYMHISYSKTDAEFCATKRALDVIRKKIK